MTKSDTIKKYYVYVLAYPESYRDKNGTDLSGVIFYVGKGTVQKYKHLPERMDAHEIEAHQGFKSAKHNAIRSIWAKGMRVQKTKVFETDNEKEALQYEQALIRLMNGSGNLTNIIYLVNDLPSIALMAKRDTASPYDHPDDALPPQSSEVSEIITEYLSITEVARELGVNDQTVRHWIKSGELPATRDRVGRHRIARTNLEEFRWRRMRRFS
jgi:excisionase family DNA binding protein